MPGKFAIVVVWLIQECVELRPLYLYLIAIEQSLSDAPEFNPENVQIAMQWLEVLAPQCRMLHYISKIGDVEVEVCTMHDSNVGGREILEVHLTR